MDLIGFHLKTPTFTGKWLGMSLGVFSRMPLLCLSQLSIINDVRKPTVSEERESEVIPACVMSVAFYICVLECVPRDSESVPLTLI